VTPTTGDKLDTENYEEYNEIFTVENKEKRLE
jgi:hypothetical protein